jgi:hypothetical protein
MIFHFLKSNFHQNFHFSEFLFLLLLCTILLTLFRFLIGRVPDDFKIGIVNESLGVNQSCSDYKINASITLDECVNETLSCEFLNHFDGVEKINFNTQEEAIIDLNRANIFGFIRISSNFSKNLLRSDDNSGPRKFMDVTLDPCVYFFQKIVKRKVMMTFQEFAADLSKRCDVKSELMLNIIKLETFFQPFSYDFSMTMTLLSFIMLSATIFTL